MLKTMRRLWGRNGAKRPKVAPRRPVRLGLESLEGRLVPTTTLYWMPQGTNLNWNGLDGNGHYNWSTTSGSYTPAADYPGASDVADLTHSTQTCNVTAGAACNGLVMDNASTYSKLEVSNNVGLVVSGGSSTVNGRIQFDGSGSYVEFAGGSVATNGGSPSLGYSATVGVKGALYFDNGCSVEFNKDGTAAYSDVDLGDVPSGSSSTTACTATVGNCLTLYNGANLNVDGTATLAVSGANASNESIALGDTGASLLQEGSGSTSWSANALGLPTACQVPVHVGGGTFTVSGGISVTKADANSREVQVVNGNLYSNHGLIKLDHTLYVGATGTLTLLGGTIAKVSSSATPRVELDTGTVDVKPTTGSATSQIAGDLMCDPEDFTYSTIDLEADAASNKYAQLEVNGMTLRYLNLDTEFDKSGTTQVNGQVIDDGTLTDNSVDGATTVYNVDTLVAPIVNSGYVLKIIKDGAGNLSASAPNAGNTNFSGAYTSWGTPTGNGSQVSWTEP